MSIAQRVSAPLAASGAETMASSSWSGQGLLHRLQGA